MLWSGLVVIPRVRPRGALGISSDEDVRRIFFGFEIFDSRIFLGTKIWQVYFLDFPFALVDFGFFRL